MINLQWDRIYAITIGFETGEGYQIFGNPRSTGLDVSFDIVKDTSDKTNKNTLKITNLADDAISLLEMKDCIVMIEVGYNNTQGLTSIFKGFVTTCTTTRSNGTVETTVQLEDGLKEIRDSVVSLSYDGDVERSKIIEDIAGEMGMCLDIAEDVDLSQPLKKFSFVGAGKDALGKVCASLDLKWHIENGVIRIIKEGGTLKQKAFVLRYDTGLIGIPTRIAKESRQTDKKPNSKAKKKKEKRAGWKVVCLLNPVLCAGDLVRIESDYLEGWFGIETLKHRGDYAGNDWFTELEVYEVQADKEESKTQTAEQEKAPTTEKPTETKRFCQFDGGIEGYNGTIDLGTRPVITNEDGSISTVCSAHELYKDGKWYVFPTVMDTNPPYIEEDNYKAMDYYVGRGRYLGVFDTEAEAKAMADKIHLQQEEAYNG